jgi:hypothetical protein
MKNRLVIFCVSALVIILLSGFYIVPIDKKDRINVAVQATAAVKTVAVKDITSTGAHCSYSIKTENAKNNQAGGFCK